MKKTAGPEKRKLVPVEEAVAKLTQMGVKAARTAANVTIHK